LTILLIELTITFFHKSSLDNDICNSVQLVCITHKFKYKYFSILNFLLTFKYQKNLIQITNYKITKLPSNISTFHDFLKIGSKKIRKEPRAAFTKDSMGLSPHISDQPFGGHRRQREGLNVINCDFTLSCT